MQRSTIPDVFDIPTPRNGRVLPWLAALAMVAIIVGRHPDLGGDQQRSQHRDAGDGGSLIFQV